MRHPVTNLVGKNSLFSFFTTVMPPFFGTTCTGLTHSLSEIEYIMPASSNLITSFFTTSLRLVFKILYGSREGLWSSSSKIRCMQREGFSPLRSSIEYLITFLCNLNSCKSFTVCVASRCAPTITGYALLRSKNS
jgi:hypothetical protein